MVDETESRQSQSYLPEYQEQFLKDLLANVYGTDPETGELTGIASRNPLEGQLVTDDEGNPVFETNPDGSQKLDFAGQPIQKTIGGVARPDIARFTDAQKQAIRLGMEGVGAYQPMMDKGAANVEKGLGVFDRGRDITEMGVTALAGTTNEDGTVREFDPNAYKAYMDPYTQEVIDTTFADINRQADMDRNRVRDSAIGAGAFGGSRGALQQSELTRNTADQMARTGAQLRSQGYGAAQQQAQSVFENQMNRGQNAAQIFNQLGQGVGTLGGDITKTGIQQAALGEAAHGARPRRQGEAGGGDRHALRVAQPSDGGTKLVGSIRVDMPTDIFFSNRQFLGKRHILLHQRANFLLPHCSESAPLFEIVLVILDGFPGVSARVSRISSHLTQRGVYS